MVFPFPQFTFDNKKLTFSLTFSNFLKIYHFYVDFVFKSKLFLFSCQTDLSELVKYYGYWNKLIHWIVFYWIQKRKRYHISSYSFCGNYTFLTFALLYVLWPLITVHKCAETIWGNTVFNSLDWTQIRGPYYSERFSIMYKIMVDMNGELSTYYACESGKASVVFKTCYIC